MNHSLTSDFSKVSFHDIPESYGIAETVSFQYTIASNLQPSRSDWIGLYRVGWKSVKEYVSYEWITLPDNYATGTTQVECVCTFKDKLPKNDEDFFQFCYINSQSKVCGASSPFQFLEDYDIVVISETESMLIVETNADPSNQRTASSSSAEAAASTEAAVQCRQRCSDEIVIVEDEVEKLHGELKETRKRLMEGDSQMKVLELQVNQLQSRLTESEDLSSQLAEDIDRLKSELLDEKEKRISTEKSLSESEKHYKKTLLKSSERELTYKEKEMQLSVALQDTQKQLCQKAQELELLKMEHSSNLSMLDVKQVTVEELTKRCSRMSAEIVQLKSIPKVEMKLREKAAKHMEQINRVQTTSKDQKLTNQLVLEKRAEPQRNTANDEVVTDGVERLTEATGEEDGRIQSESSHNKLETHSTDQVDGNGLIPSPKRTCKVCSLTFPVGTAVEVIKGHLQSHKKVCPVCSQQLELNCTQQDFEMHVTEHLVDTIKITDGRKICPVCDFEFPSAFAQDQFEIHVNGHFGDTLRR